MTRPAAKISHTEVVRLVKAVRAAGLDVHRVTYDCIFLTSCKPKL